MIATIAAGVAHRRSPATPTRASTTTDNTVTFDATAPTVTINQAAGQADPTNASPINFTVVFSEPVTGFATGDVTLGGTAGGDDGRRRDRAGTTYNVAVTGMTTHGTVIATVAAGVAHDARRQRQRRVDHDRQHGHVRRRRAPTVTINQAAGQADPTERVADQLHGRVQRAGDRLRDRRRDARRHGGRDRRRSVTGGPTTYNVAVTGMTPAGTVIATVAAGVAHRRRRQRQRRRRPRTDNTVTFDNVGADGDDQPGGRPGRPDQRERRSTSRWCSASRSPTSRPAT